MAGKCDLALKEIPNCNMTPDMRRFVFCTAKKAVDQGKEFGPAMKEAWKVAKEKCKK